MITVVLRFDGGIPGDFHLTHHLDGAVGGLGNCLRLTGQDRARRRLRIYCVGSSGGPARASVSGPDPIPWTG